jgi:methyl-accepting chemotaxis protein
LKISVRMTIALLVAALLPLIVVGAWSLYTLQQVSKLVSRIGPEAVREQAESVARDIETYLTAHPDVNLNDASQLENNADLAKIGVRTFGEKGYSAVFDDKAITHFHPNPNIIGMPLSNLADRAPDFWAILARSLDGTPTDGYYQWKDNWDDPNEPLRPKYMYIVPVANTPLRVASTTYIEDFSRDAALVRGELGKAWSRAQTQLLAILVIVVLITSAGAYLLGRRFSQPINQMVRVAARIADGDLTVEPPSSDLGEMGQLATTFRQMTGSLSSLVRRVQSMSLSLTTGTEQVMMTHRHHTAHSDEQAAAVVSSSSAVEELASSSAHISDTAQQVVAAASQTQSNALQGVQTMDQTAQRLQYIAAGNQEAVTKVRSLGNLAREIGVVMDLIEDIAAQTRMIAFNASIEASAAGAVGRRFAVVAGEVRRLASDVAQSTEEIRTKVERIQTTTNELIIASERECKEIETGQALGVTMTGLLSQIHASAQHTTQAAQQISFGTRQQRSATEHLLLDLQSLAADARAVAAGSQQTITVMEDLVTLAQDMNLAVERFKLPEVARDHAGTEPVSI